MPRGTVVMPTCKHLNARMVQNSTIVGHAFCNDCKMEVPTNEVLNNWLDHLAILKKQMDESIVRIEAMFGRSN